jgi:hypothetical protein
MLSGLENCQVGLCVQITRQRDEHGVEVVSRQQDFDPIRRVGPKAGGFLSNSLGAHGVTRFDVANRVDVDRREGESRAEQRRASAARADQAQANRRDLRRLGNLSLRDGKASGGGIAEEVAAVEAGLRHEKTKRLWRFSHNVQPS